MIIVNMQEDYVVLANWFLLISVKGFSHIPYQSLIIARHDYWLVFRMDEHVMMLLIVALTEPATTGFNEHEQDSKCLDNTLNNINNQEFVGSVK